LLARRDGVRQVGDVGEALCLRLGEVEAGQPAQEAVGHEDVDA
jgi:hypothetical protein